MPPIETILIFLYLSAQSTINLGAANSSPLFYKKE